LHSSSTAPISARYWSTSGLRPISASVGEPWRQRFCQRCGLGPRLAPPKRFIPTNRGRLAQSKR
jgi:hypothetical protein